MNRSESKYFATAAKMDEAFLTLLEKKDFAYITVKEICAAAGVNRSTFYLHYETVSDLLAESVEHMNRQFLDYMAKDEAVFVTRLHTCPMEELYLVTSKNTGVCSAQPQRMPPCWGWAKATTECSAMCLRPFWNASACRRRTGRT